MNTAPVREIRIERRDRLHVARFEAMACDCELLVDTPQRQAAQTLAGIAAREAWRIEAKFSRYRDDNIVHRINGAGGAAIEVDAETARLLDYADTCHRLSDGLFDITSGVLRRVWRFDGGDRVPTAEAVAVVLAGVGWQRVHWQAPRIRLAPGMEIDFGGIGKEYAVDRCAELIAAASDLPCVVNFGGDLRVTGGRADGRPWQVGVDTPGAPGTPRRVIAIGRGALATSGDSRRYLLRDGVRYCHLLDPRTGWPVRGAPRSVTVAAPLCIDAGMLSTLAMLQGGEAEDFLRRQGVRAWCVRD